jgi:hypothetical protein
LVIDSPLQTSVVREVGGKTVAVLTLSILVVGWFMRQTVLEVEAQNAAVPSLTRLFLALVGSVCVTTFVLMTRSLRVSHRVAGPQFAIRRAVSRFLDGERDVRVRLRGDDYLHATAEDINRLIERVVQLETEREATARTDTAQQDDAALLEHRVEAAG